MASMGSAVAGHDSARVEWFTQLLHFLEQPVVPIRDADLLWLVADAEQDLPQLNFVGPIVLIGETAADINSSAPGPVAKRISWPVTQSLVTDALAAAQRLSRQRVHSLATATDCAHQPELAGGSDEMLSLLDAIARLQASVQPALIRAAVGAPAEAIASLMHRVSKRHSGPLVPVNCALIPPELIESELFGHKRGAFPGAITDKPGRISLADNGTLYLSNIDSLSAPLQSKLMRFLQEGCIEPLGAMQSIPCNARVIAATSIDLAAAAAREHFRPDLQLALSAIELQIPRLGDRPGDLPALLKQLTHRVHQEQGISVRFTEDAIRALTYYSWPGDLQELQNLVERLSLEYPNQVVGVEELPLKYHWKPEQEGELQTQPGSQSRDDLLPVNGIDLKSHMATLEQRLIEQALADSDAVVARAADRLHIRRTTLVEKMRKYGISRAS